MDLFDSEDARILEEEGDLRVVDHERLRVRKTRFHDRGSESSDNSPPRPSTFSPVALMSSPLMSPSDIEDTVQVPKNLESLAAIEFVGFNALTARAIWTQWLETDEDGQQLFGFLQFLNDHILATGFDATYGREAYRAAFARYGFERSLIESLTDEKFDDLMHTQSSSAWGQEVIGNRYHFLQFGNTASQSRQRQRSTGVAPTRVPSFTIASGSGQTFPGISSEPGTTLFWKATLKSRALRMKSEASSPEKLAFVPIISHSPTDFDGRQAGYYFTPQLAGAIHYAQYYKRNYPNEQIVIICLRVPNNLMEGDNKCYVLRYPSEKFKKVIWLSRNSKRYTTDLMDVKNARLVIGDTTRGTAQPYQRMQSHHEVSYANLVTLQDDDGSRYKMTQYYFREEYEMILEEALKQENLTIHNADNPELEVDVNI